MATLTQAAQRSAGGRHRWAPGDRRDVRVILTLTQEEAAIIHEASRRDGLSVGPFMRMAALRRARFDVNRGESSS